MTPGNPITTSNVRVPSALSTLEARIQFTPLASLNPDMTLINLNVHGTVISRFHWPVPNLNQHEAYVRGLIITDLKTKTEKRVALFAPDESQLPSPAQFDEIWIRNATFGNDGICASLQRGGKWFLVPHSFTNLVG